MTPHDRVLTKFLERQRREAAALAAASDLVELKPLGPAPPVAYLARFRGTGLVRHADGRVVEHDDFLVGICFPDAYLRYFDTARVLTWCEPAAIWHPNIRPPFVCVGRMGPGTPLVDLLHQLHEVITYQNVEMRETNALNHAACAWARRHVDRFPLDRRPLRRRTRARPGRGAAGAAGRPGP